MRRFFSMLFVVAVLGSLAVTLAAPVASAVGTPSFTVGSASVVEGGASTRSLKIDVTLSEPATTTVGITYVVNPLYIFPPGDAATAATDYVAKTGVLTFTPNVNTGLTPVEKTVSITINGDTAVEPNESFLILIGGPTGGATVSNSVGVGTIIDDDASTATSVGIGDVEVFDGDSGPVRASQIVVALSQPATTAMSVHYTVTAGTATRTTDFTGPTSGNLNFAIGADEKVITINAVADGIVENGECLTVTLSVPSSGLTLGKSTGGVTIRDSSYRGCAGPKVTMAGDSITNLSNPTIAAAFGATYHHRIEGLPGFTIAQVTPTVQAQVATQPDVSVINLGTNDMGGANPNWQADLAAVTSLVTPVPCVEFVTIYDGHFAPVGNNVGTLINAQLVTQVAANPTMHLVDWNAAAWADPTLLSWDQVHPSTLGRQWIANHLKAAVDADC